ncbi:TerB family tellurite resistance protein [Mangrovicella endophytica]|uniref:tellurite resistance TerB family protein n=1 Tax=Mangrovicella endophytica TaxID=2066697 RepID=UPI000C9E5D3B|nr:TerB family tellurite resistance protein [Mangrovicella endophytica]
MFDSLKDFLRSLGNEKAGDLDADDPRVAAAALLFHVSEADGIVTDAERQRLRTLLADEFGLGPSETEAVAAAGQEAEAEAVDLFRFTSVLKAQLEEERRIRFVELLWAMTYADGQVHELEDNLIWRIAELLGVSTRDRMTMKHRAAARSAEAG